MTTEEAEALREQVLAWMDETGRGYKAAARHFAQHGLPASTIKGWRLGRSAAARAQVHAQARATPPEPVEPRPGEPFAVTELRQMLVDCDRDLELARRQKATSSIGQLTNARMRIVTALNEAMEAQAARERAAGELPDPADVAREILRYAEELARIVPDEVRAIMRAWRRAFGEEET